VQAAGADWTILRPTWFAQNFSESWWLRDALLEGTLSLPAGDGREPFVDAEDIAAVAIAALTEPGHAGETYELSGPRLLSFGEAVGEIAVASGQALRYVAVSPEAYAAHERERGAPPEITGILDQLCGWIAQGRNAHLSDGVQRALGREPRDFAEYVREAVAEGAWAGAATRVA
jgi:uncharacterized protein YbjT (DUF2867 family)